MTSDLCTSTCCIEGETIHCIKRKGHADAHESNPPTVNWDLTAEEYYAIYGEHTAKKYTSTLPDEQSDGPIQCESFHADRITRCQKPHNHEGNHEAEVVDRGRVVWYNYDYMAFREKAMELEPDDAINPSYYRQGSIECIDAIKSALGEAGFKAFLAGQVLKYCWRYEHKNGLEDLQKAKWYLDKLMEEFDGKNI